MANTSLIMGESGVGKSTSLRTINPSETFIINILNKPLPFKGYQKNYKTFDNENRNGNYYTTAEAKKIINTIKFVNSERPEIKTLVIDDFQYMMASEYMLRASEKSYQKFVDLAVNVWDVIKLMQSCRNDMNCFVLSHSDIDVNGVSKFKTIGKMLDEKITIEGMFSVILHAMIVDKKNVFLTQNDGKHIARSPIGLFDTAYIENDLKFVIDKMNEYYNEELEEL